MLKPSTEVLTGAVCYLGIAGVFSAISFLGEFAVPENVDVASLRSLMHAPSAKIIVPTASRAAGKE
jgi:hypothetical protein